MFILRKKGIHCMNLFVILLLLFVLDLNLLLRDWWWTG